MRYAFDYGQRWRLNGDEAVNAIIHFKEHAAGGAEGADGWHGCDPEESGEIKYLNIDLMIAGRSNVSNELTKLSLLDAKMDLGQGIYFSHQDCDEVREEYRKNGKKAGKYFGNLYCKGEDLPRYLNLASSRRPNHFEKLAYTNCQNIFENLVESTCPQMRTDNFTDTFNETCSCFFPGFVSDSEHDHPTGCPL